MAGLPSTWGIPAFAGEVAAVDALAVARVKEAGGVVLGLTNVPMPVTPTPAFPHDHTDMTHRTLDIDGVPHPYFDQIALAGVATLPGLPATALPVGRSLEGLPIGVQAIGPLCGDRTTLRFAELVEREIGGFSPRPLA